MDGDQLDFRNLKTQKENTKIISLIFELNFEFKGENTKNILSAFHPKAPPASAPGDQIMNRASSSLYFRDCSLESLPGQACQPHVTVPVTCHVSGLLCQGCQATQPRGSRACPQLNSGTLQHREAELWEPLESSSLLKQKMNSRSVLQGVGQGT